MAGSLDALITQNVPETVYWMDVGGTSTRRVSLHAAPINVATGLRMHLFEKMQSVVMTSATLCTARASASNDAPHGLQTRATGKHTPASRGTGLQPVHG